VHNGLVDTQMLFMNDEVCFHVTSYVNSSPPQKTPIWNGKNSHAVHQILLHDKVSVVWVAVSHMGIVAPVFFLKTVNLGR
jgi:hypothetical protein